MEITYRLSETEFDQNVFKSIKKIFKNRLMKISIVAEETTEIISEQDVYSKIESGQQAEHEFHFTSDQLKDFIERSIDDQSVDENQFKRTVVHQTKQIA